MQRFIWLAGQLFCTLFLKLISGLLVWIAVSNSFAQSLPLATNEDQVKAAYLYKLPNYVDWPPQSFAKGDTPYTIGIVEAEGVASELSRLSSGRRINNRPVVVRRFRFGEATDGFHLLFVGKTDRAKLVQLVRSGQSQPILLVTDQDGALGYGSMINFVTNDDRIRFEVALDAAEKSGLKLSARLLTIAVNVVKDSQR